VPALQVNGVILTQSLAILSWLAETHPTPALLPATPLARALSESLAALETLVSA